MSVNSNMSNLNATYIGKEWIQSVCTRELSLENGGDNYTFSIFDRIASILQSQRKCSTLYKKWNRKKKLMQNTLLLHNTLILYIIVDTVYLFLCKSYDTTHAIKIYSKQLTKKNSETYLRFSTFLTLNISTLPNLNDSKTEREAV